MNKEEREKCEFEVDLKKSFMVAVLIKKASKKGMDFCGQVWKRVWKMSPFSLKKGQDLENWPAHPHQEFPGVPPGGRV